MSRNFLLIFDKMKQGVRFLFLIVLAGTMAVSCKNRDPDLLSRFLPVEVNGWTVQEEDRYYNPFDISNYIDRAGEVYSAYGFQRLLVRLYEKKGQPVIHVDFFDMGSPKNAFGIFSFNPIGEEVGVGQGSSFSERLLVFWKDRYFVSIYAENESDQAAKTLVAMGKAMASSITNEGDLPALVSRLPQNGLISRRVHFFFSHLILNHLSFITGENILKLGEEAPAVLGRYGGNDEVYSLLLVEYSDALKASAAQISFRNRFLPQGFEQSLWETEAGKWMAVRASEELLIILWNAPSQAAAEALLSSVK